jgi:hypothetical protein
MTSKSNPPSPNPFAPPETNVDDVLHLRGSSIQLEYEMRRMDYFLFLLLHQFGMGSLQLLYIAFSVLFGFVLAESGAVVAVLGGLLLYLAQWIAQAVFMLVVAMVGNNQRLYTQHVVEARTDAFIVSTRYSKLSYYWFGIEKVLLSPWVTAIYVNKHVAHVIPNRAFPDKQAREGFVKLINENRSAESAAPFHGPA